jgi:hypothetical protein
MLEPSPLQLARLQRRVLRKVEPEDGWSLANVGDDGTAVRQQASLRGLHRPQKIHPSTLGISAGPRVWGLCRLARYQLRKTHEPPRVPGSPWRSSLQRRDGEGEGLVRHAGSDRGHLEVHLFQVRAKGVEVLVKDEDTRAIAILGASIIDCGQGRLRSRAAGTRGRKIPVSEFGPVAFRSASVVVVWSTPPGAHEHTDSAASTEGT